MFHAKKDKDEQVLLAEDQAWMESSSDSGQEINANMLFMAQIEKVLSDSEASSSSADDKIFEEKANLETIESLKSKGFESSEKVVSKTENKSENDCQVIKKVCNSKDNPNVIAPGMFKLSVSQSVSPISLTKTSCASNGVESLPKMKFKKDHLCFACEQGKIHQKHHKSKIAFDSNKALYLLYMDLCGPINVENEASDVIISFIKKTQVNLQLQVQRVRTDNGTEFKNKTLAKFFDEFGITQQFFAARTPQQNSVVKKRNQTLVKVVRTMLTFANLPLFLWAEAITTAC
nr:hypothetical protein [Tanacetum cinerariifolium]